jgi:hypothetical protein
MRKDCIILNSRYNWVLLVDNHFITFECSTNADYFEKHYKKLKYNVERYDNFYKKTDFERRKFWGLYNAKNNSKIKE